MKKNHIYIGISLILILVILFYNSSVSENFSDSTDPTVTDPPNLPDPIFVPLRIPNLDVPYGTITTKASDGTLTAKSPDGTIYTQTPDGTLTTNFPSGMITTKAPDGTKTVKYVDGSITTTAPDGTMTENRNDGIILISTPDGTQTTKHPDGTLIINNPDRTITIKDRNGTMTIKAPDVTRAPDGIFRHPSSPGQDLLKLSHECRVAYFGLATNIRKEGKIANKYDNNNTIGLVIIRNMADIVIIQEMIYSKKVTGTPFFNISSRQIDSLKQRLNNIVNTYNTIVKKEKLKGESLSPIT